MSDYGIFFCIFPAPSSLDFRPHFRHPEFPQTLQGLPEPSPAPHAGEKSGVFCFCHRCAAGLSPVGCGYILAEQRPDVRETQAALCWPGSVFRLFLCPIPKQHRCPMFFRFFLSSRWLRLRYRLLSLLALHVGHAAATLALGALLSLPFVMMACGNAR